MAAIPSTRPHTFVESWPADAAAIALGVGYDVRDMKPMSGGESGALKQCIRHVEDPPMVPEDFVRVKACTEVNEVREFLELRASAGITSGFAKYDVSGRFANEMSRETCMTMILADAQVPVRATKLGRTELTKEAANMLMKTPTRFYAKYGTHFVDSIQYVARLIGCCKALTSSSSLATSLCVDFAAKAPNARAAAHTEIHSFLSKRSRSVSVDLAYSGVLPSDLYRQEGGGRPDNADALFRHAFDFARLVSTQEGQQGAVAQMVLVPFFTLLPGGQLPDLAQCAVTRKADIDADLARIYWKTFRVRRWLEPLLKRPGVDERIGKLCLEADALLERMRNPGSTDPTDKQDVPEPAYLTYASIMRKMTDAMADMGPFLSVFRTAWTRTKNPTTIHFEEGTVFFSENASAALTVHNYREDSGMLSASAVHPGNHFTYTFEHGRGTKTMRVQCNSEPHSTWMQTI
eukprot:CAMPEP_0174237294 /NCGR_PEP_ID=MMETSP0417-20130205/7762_1 /TAXON_ID=242541 /ORGANISM="Mayorella sp, Strain BSH-02190019" /LENGTH=461 /DNA_ID=CAMNT_0015316035 /DNA_START=233 /DNA_END=1618 /DNA_ORIENTATION=-